MLACRDTIGVICTSGREATVRVPATARLGDARRRVAASATPCAETALRRGRDAAASRASAIRRSRPTAARSRSPCRPSTSAATSRPKQIYVVPLDGRRAAQDHRRRANERPRWSPDSKTIAFVSDRGGSSQIWMMNADGANAKQVTNLSTEADGVLFSPDGKNLVFTSDVYPECGADDACNKQKLDAEKNKQGARRASTTALLYRHWTTWQSAAPQPSAGGPGGRRRGQRSDARRTRDVPPFSLGGPDDYAISPDGTEVCYAMNADAGAGHQHQFRSLRGPDRRAGRRRKSPSIPAPTISPQYSPDGKYIALSRAVPRRI